jgi:hypothetical protein
MPEDGGKEAGLGKIWDLTKDKRYI